MSTRAWQFQCICHIGQNMPALQIGWLDHRVLSVGLLTAVKNKKATL